MGALGGVPQLVVGQLGKGNLQLPPIRQVWGSNGKAGEEEISSAYSI